MGWTDSHLHAFTMGDQRYGMHVDDYPEDEIDENEVSVLKAVGERRRLSTSTTSATRGSTAVVEEVTRRTRGLKFAVCIDGQNACPPEDCGGAVGTPSYWRAWPIPATGTTSMPFGGSVALLILRRSISSLRTWRSSTCADRNVVPEAPRSSTRRLAPHLHHKRW